MKYLILFLVLITSFAHAKDMRSIRCKGGFVKLDMDKYKVMDLCGTPLDREVISGSDGDKVEKLVYKFKKLNSAPMTFFTFKAGKLKLIEQSK